MPERVMRVLAGRFVDAGAGLIEAFPDAGVSFRRADTGEE